MQLHCTCRRKNRLTCTSTQTEDKCEANNCRKFLLHPSTHPCFD